jgi:hypothetical protein
MAGIIMYIVIGTALLAVVAAIHGLLIRFGILRR